MGRGSRPHKARLQGWRGRRLGRGRGRAAERVRRRRPRRLESGEGEGSRRRRRGGDLRAPRQDAASRRSQLLSRRQGHARHLQGQALRRRALGARGPGGGGRRDETGQSQRRLDRRLPDQERAPVVMSLKLLFHSNADSQSDWKKRLGALDPSIEVRVWPDAGDLSEIEAALVWKPPHGLMAKLPRLKLILSLG